MEDKIGYLQTKIREQQEEMEKLKDEILKINEIDHRISKRIKDLLENHFFDLKKEAIESAEKRYSELFTEHISSFEKDMRSLHNKSNEPLIQLLQDYHKTLDDSLNESTRVNQLVFDIIIGHIRMLEKILFKKELITLEEAHLLEEYFNKQLPRK